MITVGAAGLGGGGGGGAAGNPQTSSYGLSSSFAIDRSVGEGWRRRGPVTAARQMVKTVAMGFTVNVVAVFRSSPSHHVLDVLADHFGHVDHAPGSKTVNLTEHVAISDEADAVALVRSLMDDALPEGARITELTATAD